MAASVKLLPFLSRRTAYVGLGLLITFSGILWLGPGYFGPLVADSVSAPFVIHFLAAVFVCWLAIFIEQIEFAAAGRMALHIRPGNTAIQYGVFLIIVGLATDVAVALCCAIRVHLAQNQQGIESALLFHV